MHRGRMEQILLANRLLKETVTAIIMLYRNTKVHSPDGDTDYFNIVAGVLQGDTLALYLFIIFLNYMLKTSIDKMKVNGFKLAKERSRRYPTQTITDADYTDDISLLANTLAQAENLLHSQERTAAGIGLHVNVNKMEYSSLKLEDKFTYLGSRVSSTETDINTLLANAQTAINRQSVIWKSDLTDKIKSNFFQAALVSILLYGCTT